MLQNKHTNTIITWETTEKNFMNTPDLIIATEKNKMMVLGIFGSLKASFGEMEKK